MGARVQSWARSTAQDGAAMSQRRRHRQAQPRSSRPPRPSLRSSSRQESNVLKTHSKRVSLHN